MFKNSYGYVVYDPKNENTRFEPGWSILKCSEGLANFYRYLISKDAVKLRTSSEVFGIGESLVTMRGIRLTRPAWGSHISVTRGEEVKNKYIWSKYSGHKIWFEYDPIPQNYQNYWWLNVYCERLIKIRTELGLPHFPEVPFHLTIGYETKRNRSVTDE